MKISKLLLLACLFSSMFCYSQTEEVLKNIDNQVWHPFTKAFETFDYNLFSSIHSKDSIRVNADGKRTQNKETYIDGYKERWKSIDRKQTISFRFLQRLNNENSA